MAARPLKPPGNKCPQNDSREACNLQCKYNHFSNEEVTIDSWELKCLDCGYRETIAYRSDDSDLDLEATDSTTCPFCHQCDLPPGKNPCSTDGAAS